MDIYNQLLKKYRNGPKAVGWGSKESQELRFKVLCDIDDLSGKTILDYGCGLGDLFSYLCNSAILMYVGYDRNEKMIAKALKSYPYGVFRDYIEAEKYDYVFASGTFNLEEKEWTRKTYKELDNMWQMCKKGVSVNFLSVFAEKKDKKCHYVNPTEMIKFARKLTNWFTIRHDYKENDFTLYMYK